MTEKTELRMFTNQRVLNALKKLADYKTDVVKIDLNNTATNVFLPVNILVNCLDDLSKTGIIQRIIDGNTLYFKVVNYE